MKHPHYQSFLETHQLPESYLDTAFKAYQPVIDDILLRLKNNKPVILGINGCQGSGKSTSAAFLEYIFQTAHQLNTVNISLDDFYLSKSARLKKAATIHPLFAIRGVPGTHDIDLALQTMTDMMNGRSPKISRFNKAIDDLFPEENWDTAPQDIDLIILEGWFLSAQPQADFLLNNPVNDLEAQEDPQGVWRQYVNQQLKGDYQTLFQLVDCLVMLKAPSFDTVFTWRLEQEMKLAKKLLLPKQTDEASHTGVSHQGLMNETEIKRFVQFFQRLTESMLKEMPKRADHCYFLNTERQIIYEQHKHSNN